MKTLSVKIDESLLEKLNLTARKRGETRSDILRAAIESIIEGDDQIGKGSCLDLAKDLAGTISGPKDLSFNKKRMEDYGQ